MKSLPPLDMIRLSDLLLKRLRDEGKVHLDHHEIRIQFQREPNYPGPKFDIHVFIFEEEFSNAYYTLDCSTPERIIDILFAHAESDYGYTDTRHGLITVKRQSLESRLSMTVPRVRNLLKTIFSEEEALHADIYVDEEFPYDKLDAFGFPHFRLVIRFADGREYSIPMDSRSANVEIGQKVLEQVAKLQP